MSSASDALRPRSARVVWVAAPALGHGHLHVHDIPAAEQASTNEILKALVFLFMGECALHPDFDKGGRTAREWMSLISTVEVVTSSENRLQSNGSA